MSISGVLRRILIIMQECNENVQHDPRTAFSWNLKGIALSNEGKYREAIEAFDKAIELAPTWNKPMCNRDIALQNMCLQEKRVKSRASAACSQAAPAGA